MIKEFIQTFRKPSAASIAQRELEEAQRQALAHRSAAEYHLKLSEYSDGLVKRLTAYIKNQE